MSILQALREEIQRLNNTNKYLADENTLLRQQLHKLKKKHGSTLPNQPDLSRDNAGSRRK